VRNAALIFNQRFSLLIRHAKNLEHVKDLLGKAGYVAEVFSNNDSPMSFSKLQFFISERFRGTSNEHCANVS